MFESTWRHTLPDDEIGRHEQAKASLIMGCIVNVEGVGPCRYAGLWDTMHSFYPTLPQGQEVIQAYGDPQHAMARYVRRDFHGRLFLKLPYTLLADYIKQV